MQKEVKRLQQLAKKVLQKKTIRKLKAIEDKHECLQATQYALAAALRQQQYTFEATIAEHIAQGKDTFIAQNKALLIPSKIKHFQVNYDQEELQKVLTLFASINRELKHV